MAKPEPWRLDPANYPYTTALQTRFGDLDVQMHINNVAMAALFENGRVRFHREIRLADFAGEGTGMVVAALDISYLQDGRFPDDVELASGIGRLGNSSWEILSAAFQSQGCVATARMTIVHRKPHGPAPIPDKLRAALEKYLIRRD